MGNNTRLTKCHTNALTTLRHYKQWTTYSVISHLCQVRRHNSTNTRQNPAKTTPRARPRTTPATSNTQYTEAPQHVLQHTHPNAQWRPHRLHKGRDPPRSKIHPTQGNNAATKGANLDPAPTNHNIQFARIKLNTVSICTQIMLRCMRSVHLNTCIFY